MSKSSAALLLWSPRVLGVLVCLFLSLFAFDVFGHGKSLLQSLLAFLVHLLPMLVLLVAVMLSWRREWIGGLVFVLFALGYAHFARRHVDWIALVAGPVLVVGILFLCSWGHRRKLHRPA